MSFILTAIVAVVLVIVSAMFLTGVALVAVLGLIDYVTGIVGEYRRDRE